MIDREDIEDLREAAQTCDDVVDGMYFVDSDDELPQEYNKIEELLCAASENINEAVELLKRG